MKKCSKAISSTLGKPESYVAVCVNDGQDIIWNGEDSPCALGVVYSLGSINQSNNGALTKQLSTLLDEHGGVPDNRIYVSFFDVPRENMCARPAGPRARTLSTSICIARPSFAHVCIRSISHIRLVVCAPLSPLAGAGADGPSLADGEMLIGTFLGGRALGFRARCGERPWTVGSCPARLRVLVMRWLWTLVSAVVCTMPMHGMRKSVLGGAMAGAGAPVGRAS